MHPDLITERMEPFAFTGDPEDRGETDNVASMNNEVSTKAVTLGAPMWEGDITYSMAQLICSGLERIKPEHLEAVMKRFAFEWMAMRQENATLREERGTERDALEDYKGKLWCALGQPLNVEYIEAVKQLRANLAIADEHIGTLKTDQGKMADALARMQAPVTDEEWAATRRLGSHGQDSWRTISRLEVDALLEARAAGKGNESR